MITNPQPDLSVRLARAALTLDEVVTEIEAAKLTDRHLHYLASPELHARLAACRLTNLLDRIERFGTAEAIPITAAEARQIAEREAT